MKKFLWVLSGVISACLLSFCVSTSVGAINIDVSRGGNYQLLNSSRLYSFSGAAFAPSYQYTGGSRSLFFQVEGTNPSHVNLIFDTSFVSGSVVSFYLSSSIGYPNSGRDAAMMGLAPNSKSYTILDIQPEGNYYRVSILCLTPINSIDIIFSNNPANTAPSGNLYVIPSGYYTLQNVDVNSLKNDLSSIKAEVQAINSLLQQIKNAGQAQVDATNSAKDQAHSDSQAQLDYQKEQAKKEEDQRKADEEKANQAGSSSQTGSDTAQSDVSGASQNLLSALTTFSSAIVNTSPGDCGLSANFGFFDAGNIDLCSGASKITPITNVVGTVMLVGLTIPAIISLCHKFIDLYNEVTT